MSDTGQTSVFEFPIVRTESTKNRVDMHPSAFRAGQAPSELHVLVVDDNPSNLAEACDLLSHWGITPIVAMDGAEAVAVARERELDLILMDLQMPVLDGLAATKQIRAGEQERRSPRAPVLAYTSCVIHGDVLRQCGLDGVLEKPCSAVALQECLRRWCGPRGGN
jgi:two-component system, sensor histidine kinase and response regulator